MQKVERDDQKERLSFRAWPGIPLLRSFGDSRLRGNDSSVDFLTTSLELKANS
jgi:hypothetical protein